MAQRTHIEVTDDLDGSQADETVEFALDGHGFIIDLTTEHAKQLRSAFADYIAAGRRQPRAAAAARRPVRSGAANSTESRRQSQAIRDWARARGYSVAARGRIPERVVEAYHQRGAA